MAKDQQTDAVTDTLADVRRVIAVRQAALQTEMGKLQALMVALDNGHVPEAPSRPKRASSAMSAKQRKAVSLRMKRYWAERRKAKVAQKAKRKRKSPPTPAA